MKHIYSFAATLVAVVFAGLSLSSTQAQDATASFIPGRLENAQGESISRESLKGKVVALYFSAHRCVRCRAFTPTLVEFYEKHKGDDFEIVFVSFDNTPEMKKQYIEETGMNFLSVAGNKARVHFDLANQYKVSMLPRLIVFNPDGTRVSEDSMADINSEPELALLKWKTSR